MAVAVYPVGHYLRSVSLALLAYQYSSAVDTCSDITLAISKGAEGTGFELKYEGAQAMRYQHKRHVQGCIACALPPAGIQKVMTT